ncbi:MAG: hypothetical protein N4A40_11405 [Tissierellales bacterium]|jgi:hypothetical protein|nr:hypothetical protein [Tissierellales bacterium]
MSFEEMKKIEIDKPIGWVEKKFKVNARNLKWEIEHKDELVDINGKNIKIYNGVTSAYGAATLGSLLGQGGGYAPFYLKITEIDESKTELFAFATGTENVSGDLGNRNRNIVKYLLEMCQEDCERKTLKDGINWILGK